MRDDEPATNNVHPAEGVGKSKSDPLVRNSGDATPPPGAGSAAGAAPGVGPDLDALFEANADAVRDWLKSVRPSPTGETPPVESADADPAPGDDLPPGYDVSRGPAPGMSNREWIAALAVGGRRRQRQMTRERALRWWDAGFNPVADKYGTKQYAWVGSNALSREEMKARIDRGEEFPRHESVNLAVKLGELPDGFWANVTDYDAALPRDVHAALHEALHLGTVVYGRWSKLISHAIVFTRGKPVGKVAKYTDPLLADGEEGRVLVERKGTGGSDRLSEFGLHKSGEPIFRTSPPDQGVAVSDPAEYVRMVTLIAVALLLGRYWPGKGQRHDAHLALAGGLLRAGVPVERVEAVARAVCALTGDREVKARLADVRSTADAHRDGLPFTGFQRLRKLLRVNDPRIIDAVEEWLADCYGVEAAPSPFPVHALPDGVREFAVEAAKALNCPVESVAVPAIVAAAAAIGMSRNLEIKKGWYAPSILWAGLVLPSGTRKSPALEAVLRPLRRIAVEESESFDLAMEAYKLAKAAAGRGARQNNAGTNPPTASAIPKPVEKRVISDDPTVEALAVLLTENPRGVSVIRDELAGLFSGLGQYKKNGGAADRAKYLELYNAGSFTSDRKNPEAPKIRVRNTGSSIAGTIQPGVLQKLFSAEDHSSGLTARFLWAMPPVPVNKWVDDEIPDYVTEDYDRLIRGLFAIPHVMVQGRTGSRPRPTTVKLAPEARELRNEYVNRLGQLQAKASDQLKAVYAKLEETAFRLTLVIHTCNETHAGRDGMADVTVESLRAGVELADWFRGEAERIFRLFSGADPGRELADVLAAAQKIAAKSKGVVTVRAFQQRGPRKFRDNPRAALGKLVDAGYAVWSDDKRSGVRLDQGDNDEDAGGDLNDTPGGSAGGSYGPGGVDAPMGGASTEPGGEECSHCHQDVAGGGYKSDGRKSPPDEGLGRDGGRCSRCSHPPGERCTRETEEGVGGVGVSREGGYGGYSGYRKVGRKEETTIFQGNSTSSPSHDTPATGETPPATGGYTPSNPIKWLAETGVPVDRTALDHARAEQGTTRDDAARKIDAIHPQPADGRPIRWHVPADVKRAFASLGHTLADTQRDALLATSHPLAGEVVRYNTAIDLLEDLTEIKGALQADGRMYPTWNPDAAVTGRIYSSKPNPQGLARVLRHVVAAPEGRTLVMADYAQIELLVAAVASGDFALLEAIRSGVDMHRAVAAAMFGKQPHEVSDVERAVGKRLNFSGLYNVGPAKFARTLRAAGVPTTTAEARVHLDKFSQAYPVLDWWRRALGVVEGHVTTLTGRAIPVADGDHWGTRTSYVVQGSACDGFKRALGILFDTRDTVPGANLVLALHDAVVVEVPAGEADVAAGWVEKAMLDGMVSVLGDVVPVRVGVKVSPVWLP